VPDNEFDVAGIGVSQLVRKDGQHSGLKIHCVYLALCANLPRDREAEVPRSGTDVGDDHAGFEAELLDDLLRRQPNEPIGAIQPGCLRRVKDAIVHA
jgi:hypothetical protein